MGRSCLWAVPSFNTQQRSVPRQFLMQAASGPLQSALTLLQVSLPKDRNGDHTFTTLVGLGLLSS